jgi:rhodanese-related sulfurtransferase
MCIIAAGIVAGVIVNVLSPQRIPWVRSPKRQLASAEEASLVRSRALWESGAAVFLDARSEQDYAGGHIAGALSLPVTEFDAAFSRVRPKLDPEMPLVAYCDGEHCDLSQRLLMKLQPLGFTNALVLVNGWTVWQKAGLPVRQGGEP